MKTYIALIRGINIVGRRRLPMQDLRVLMGKHGCADVQTYIQSGNAIFRSNVADVRQLSKRLSTAVLKTHGFEPQVLVLSAGELAKATAGNPFPQADANPKTLHLFCLAERPVRPDLAALEAVKSKTERYALKGKIFYLLTPDGFGISKLAERAERARGVAAPARNWRTVRTLLAMATGPQS